MNTKNDYSAGYRSVTSIDHMKLLGVAAYLGYVIEENMSEKYIRLTGFTEDIYNDNSIEMHIDIDTEYSPIVGFLIKAYILPPTIISTKEDAQLVLHAMETVDKDVEVLIKSLN